MQSRILRRAARTFGRLSVLLGLMLATLPAFAQITISGVTDKSTYTPTATFTVVTQAGYSYAATLNSSPVPVGTAVTVTRMDYYDLQAWRSNLASPFDVASNLVRFIVIAADRGDPEKGLIKWTPYPLISSTAAEWVGAQLEIMTPQDYPAGLPIPVIARAEDAQGRERRANGFVTVPGFEASPVKLLRGHGSGFLPAAASGATLNYNASLHAMQAPRQINIDSNTAWTSVSGILPLAVAWPENSRIYLTGHVTVPTNGTLTIGAGTIIKLNPLVNITNSGLITIDGTAARPVVFTATNVVWPEKPAGAWGGFLLRGANAQLVANSTIFAGGGGATSFSFTPGASHRSEQAVLLIHSGAHASLTNCAIINTAGQVANGYNCDYILDHCLCQRAITCGEYSGSSSYVLINHTAIIEFPEDNGIVDATIANADYDGIYFTEGTHIILNSLVGFAMDDAMDSGSGSAGTMWVSNCWVESALHEAHAWSGGGRQAWSYDSVLMNSGQGLECGWSTGNDSPLVYGERMLTTANSVGTRFGDNYTSIGSGFNGFLRVSNSLALYNYRDIFLKTWNNPGTGWQTNSWVDRLQQIDIRSNFLTTADARVPGNQVWNPAADGWRLTHWMTTPPDAPVGIGLALRTNRFALAQITNGVPVRLSSFTTNFVSVDYVVLGSSGPVASGTLEFAPGETLKNIPPVWTATNEPVVELVLKNPVRGELTSVSQAWYLGQGQTNSGPVGLVAPGSRWNYLDTGTNAGTAWRQLGYDDSSWSNGLAQLGFGDSPRDEVTLIRRTNSSGANIITFYFRQTFTVTNPAQFADLSLWLLRDDGGVVYLNGTEVFRSDSLPQPPTVITYQTLATNYNNGTAPPDNTIDRATLSIALLQPGTNIVTVEIHQQAASSSDLSFDFSLTGNPVSSTSPPVISRSPTNQTVLLGGTAVFNVEATGRAPLVCQWWHNSQRVEATISPVLTLTNVTAADAGNYFVVVVNSDGRATSQVATLTIPDADTDGDGMPDAWELAHGLNPAVNDANLDPDNDGMMNLQEFLAGTDPQDKASILKWESITQPAASNGVVAISFQAVAGHDYRVQYCDQVQFGTWYDLTNLLVTGTNGTVTVFDAGATNETRRFYRVRTP